MLSFLLYILLQFKILIKIRLRRVKLFVFITQGFYNNYIYKVNSIYEYIFSMNIFYFFQYYTLTL